MRSAALRLTAHALAFFALGDSAAFALQETERLESLRFPLEWGWSTERPDSAGPIGVSLDQPLRDGEWRLTYRILETRADGLADGSSGLSNEDVFDAGFTTAPLERTSTTHLMSLLYGAWENVSLVAEVPFHDRESEHATEAGTSFSNDSSGLGDVRLGALWRRFTWGREQFFWSGLVSIPSGSFDERDAIPGVGSQAVLPYPMQLGSGTFELIPGFTFLGQGEKWSWGFQAQQTMRVGENDQDYRLGNRSDATLWFGRRLGDAFAGSMRLAALRQGDVHGEDERLAAQSDPSAIGDHQGEIRLDLGLGLQYGGRRNHFALEIGMPLVQDVEGPALETELWFGLGWRGRF